MLCNPYRQFRGKNPPLYQIPRSKTTAAEVQPIGPFGDRDAFVFMDPSLKRNPIISSGPWNCRREISEASINCEP